MTIQVPPAVGTSGQFVDSIVITSSTNIQVVTIGSPVSTAEHASVTGGYLGIVSASSGLVQISGNIVSTATTITSGTVTLSSAIAISSGTITSTATTITSGTVTLSSAIAISSGTILSTAATNPWSSAPTFNVPVINASSGIIQILDSTAQAYSIFMTVTSSAGVQSTSIKASAGVLKGYSIFNTNAAARFFRFYNTASTPTVGSDTPVITLIIPGSTAGAGAVQTLDKGLNFATGIAMAVTDAIGTTSTGAISAGDIAANIYYT